MKAISLTDRIKKRVTRTTSRDVFLRKDFDDLGSYDQVGRALRDQVKSGTLIKLGYGVYARSVKSPLSGKTMPPKGLRTLIEAVERLGYKTKPTQLEKAYNAGQTTQVPSGRVVAVEGRISRKLSYNGISLSYERA
jgi:hypothetical protein